MSATGREDIYERARADGLRRLSAPPLMRAAAALVAGAIVSLSIVGEATAAAIVTAMSGPGVGAVAGGIVFAAGLTLAVGGRFELFGESLYATATATAGEGAGRRLLLVRLSLIALAMNLFGAAVLAAAFAVDGALPTEIGSVLAQTGEAVAQTTWAAVAVRGLLAGILLALLSYLSAAVDVARSRWVIAYMVGFLLAIGPFDYVVISAPRLLVSYWIAGDVQYLELAAHMLLSVIGNIAGVLVFFAMTRNPTPDPQSS